MQSYRFEQFLGALTRVFRILCVKEDFMFPFNIFMRPLESFARIKCFSLEQENFRLFFTSQAPHNVTKFSTSFEVFKQNKPFRHGKNRFCGCSRWNIRKWRCFLYLSKRSYNVVPIDDLNSILTSLPPKARQKNTTIFFTQ